MNSKKLRIAIFQPIIGGLIDNARETGTSIGLSGDALELAAGQETFEK